MSHRDIAVALTRHAREHARDVMATNMLETAIVTQADADAVVFELHGAGIEIDDGDARWNTHVDPASLQVDDELVVAMIGGDYYVLARLALGIEDESFADDFGDGAATVHTITHNLHTRDVIVQFRYNAGGSYQSFDATWEATTTDTITVRTPGKVLALNEARVMIQSV
jgi:hypothetical protein